MSVVQLIQQSFDAIAGKTYLEIGIAKGITFSRINAELKIGVDPVSPSPQITEKLAANVQYYQMASDDFFANQAGLFEGRGLDLAYIDGLHSYRQALRDVENCLGYLNKNSIIIMHDCNPKTIGLMQDGCSGDVWRTIVHLRSMRQDLHVFVLDYDYGLGFVTCGSPENNLAYPPENIAAMSFQDLDNNRETLLNLKPSVYFDSFIKTVRKIDSNGLSSRQ
jgi:hypothetical protein